MPLGTHIWSRACMYLYDAYEAVCIILITMYYFLRLSKQNRGMVAMFLVMSL